MSMQFYKTTEPRLEFNEQPIYTIPESASEVTYRRYPVTSYSDNNINFQTTLDRKFAVSSKMFMNVQFDVTINGTPAPGGRLVNLGQCGPRFMPLTSITQTLEVALNNQTFSQKINFYHDALMRYNNTFDEVGGALSMCPSMFDYYQNYSDYLLYGSALNALGGIGEAGPGIEPRGGFPYQVVAGNGIDQNFAVVRFTTYEPIILSPLNWSLHNSKSFINLNTVTVNYTFQTDLGRVWCVSSTNGGTITSLTASISAPPVLELITMSPKIFQNIIPDQRYAYGEIQQFTQVAGELAPNASTTINAQNITLSGVPSRVYVYLRRRDQDRTFATTDTYARINGINLLFGNNPSIFTQCSPQQLYAISAQNGYLGSFSDWFKYSGSVFCMDFAKDVSVRDMQAAGLQENMQFQINIDYTNINQSESINFQLYTIVVYDGLVTITSEGEVRKERNILTKGLIEAAPNTQYLPYSTVDTFSVQGGSFSSKLRHVTSSVKNIAKKGIQAYQNLPPGVREMIKDSGKAGLDLISPRLTAAVEEFGPAAADVVKSMVGAGYTENQIYSKLLQLQGSGMKGGKYISQAQLKKKLKAK